MDNTTDRPLDLRSTEDFYKNPCILAQANRFLAPGAAVFTMGSCFAMEVRTALKASGFVTYPDYRSVACETQSVIFDRIFHSKAGRETPAHYNTFTIRQEFEAAFGVWTNREEGFWEVRDRPVNEHLRCEVAIQDPYRKMTYGRTPEALRELSDGVTQAIREGIEKSSALVITLGLTEVWLHNKTGRAICLRPDGGYGGGKGQSTFHLSSFFENYENMKVCIDLLLSRYPEKKVILSVSPIRLARTFADVDAGTANLESKSILRAVAGQLAREYPQNVIYFPAYEFAMLGLGAMTNLNNVFSEDGRHPRTDFVNSVVSTFMQMMVK